MSYCQQKENKTRDVMNKKKSQNQESEWLYVKYYRIWH